MLSAFSSWHQLLILHTQVLFPLNTSSCFNKSFFFFTSVVTRAYGSHFSFNTALAIACSSPVETSCCYNVLRFMLCTLTQWSAPQDASCIHCDAEPSTCCWPASPTTGLNLTRFTVCWWQWLKRGKQEPGCQSERDLLYHVLVAVPEKGS